MLSKILKAVAMEQCIGCYSCVLACARLVHNSLSLVRSGIQIRSRGGLMAGFEARLCLACPKAPCIEACPTGAMAQRKSGGVHYQEKLCIRCGKCAGACPVKAITMDDEKDIPIVCTHCGNCVNFCPHGCLAMVTPASCQEIIT